MSPSTLSRCPFLTWEAGLAHLTTSSWQCSFALLQSLAVALLPSIQICVSIKSRHLLLFYEQLTWIKCNGFYKIICKFMLVFCKLISNSLLFYTSSILAPHPFFVLFYLFQECYRGWELWKWSGAAARARAQGRGAHEAQAGTRQNMYGEL